MKIGIYTSRQPIQRTPIVRPQADTQVSDAIGKLGETVGDIAMDWASAKEQDTAQRELASGMVNYKSKMSDYITGVKDNPEYNPNWEDDFNKKEKEIRGGIEFTNKRAKQGAERNFENYRISYKANLANIDRQKYQRAGRIQLDTDLDAVVKMRDKGEVKRLLESSNLLLSGAERESENLIRESAIETLQAGDLLKVDIDADLSGFKLIQDQVAGLRKAEGTRRHNEEVLFEKHTGEQQLKNGTDLFTQSNTSVIPQADIDALLIKKEISKETAVLLSKPQKANAITDNAVWNELATKVANVGNKYKDKIALQNEIIKSNRIDGTLEFKDAQRLIGAITNPPSKSKINDFVVAKKYFKGLEYLDDIQRNDLLRILDKEMREGLTGKAVLDRAMEMSKQIEVLEVDMNPKKFINIFIPKAWEGSLTDEELETARTKWVEEEMKARKVEQLIMKDIVTKKEKSAPAKEKIYATNPKTERKIYSNDNGNTWFDVITNEVIK